MSEHTPGPWSVSSGYHDDGRPMGGKLDCIDSPGGWWIAECCSSACHGDESISLPAEANARLIAAAPDMLAALEAIMKLVNRNVKTRSTKAADLAEDAFMLGRAAIAKARGKA